MATSKVAIKELLGYLSADATACGWLTGQTVEDILFGSMKKSRTGDVDYDALVESMREQGMKYPIHVGAAEDMGPEYGFDPMGFEGYRVMGNGHHRLNILVSELDASFDDLVEVTDSKAESGYRHDGLALAA